MPFVNLGEELRKPIEVQVLSNVACVDLGRNRIWCDALVIEPVTENLGQKLGRVVGHWGQSSAPPFIRFYGEGEKIEFTQNLKNPHGTLKVGNDTYSVAAHDLRARVSIETRRFDDGVPGLNKYILELLR